MPRYTTPSLLRNPKATLYYRATIPLFFILEPTPPSFSQPMQVEPHTFHCDLPNSHQVSVSVHLPNREHNCKYHTFQYVQLWQSLISATADLNPPLPEEAITNLWAQMLSVFYNKWSTVCKANNPT